MNNFLKICFSSIVISGIACFAELVLLILEFGIMGLDKDVFNVLIGLSMLVTFAVASFSLVITGHCFWRICRKKEWLDKLQMGISLMCSDVVYIIMMFTVFQACCYYLKIGEGYGEGLFLAVVWFVSMAVAVVHFWVVLAVTIYQQKQTAAK